MKKLWITGVVLAAVLTMAACGSPDNSQESEPPETSREPEPIVQEDDADNEEEPVGSYENASLRRGFVERFVRRFGDDAYGHDELSVDGFSDEDILWFTMEAMYNDALRENRELQTDDSGRYLFGKEAVALKAEYLFGIDDFLPEVADSYNAELDMYTFAPDESVVSMGFMVGNEVHTVGDMLIYYVTIDGEGETYQARFLFEPADDADCLRFMLIQEGF